MTALGGFLEKYPHRIWMLVSLALVAIGVAALFALSWYGGIGGRSGHSWWLALVLVPYPVGWVLGLLSGVMALVASFRYHIVPR
jgi:hypothetical protein